MLGDVGEDERKKSDDACFSNGEEIFDGGLCLGTQLVTMHIRMAQNQQSNASTHTNVWSWLYFSTEHAEHPQSITTNGL